MTNYTITHLHTEMSNGVTNIDSITDYKEYIQKAVECGMNAIAFTEHGSILQWLHKKEECEKNGLKYIHASEVYITESLEEKVRDNYHCCLYALNYDGFLELNKLSSQSFNRQDGHFYYMPRITFNELINTSDNIAISTACLAGILSKGNDTIKEQFISFLTTNKHRCFLEIQHHNVEAQIEYNKALYTLHKSIGVPLIVGTDTHALNNEHLKGRSILQKAKDIHFDDEDEWDLTFKSYEELVGVYKLQNSLPMDVVYEALENTNRLADMVEEFEIDRQYKYPHLWDKPLELFRDKINAGIITRGVDKYPNCQEYLDRIEYEIEAYIHNGAIDFMLLMEDIISWCKSEGIEVGYGRGSVNGSVIAWLLGITEMDSIKYNLNFDRFMNVERVSLSDIDTDFSPLDIPKVKDYIYNKHGLYCCDIVTFNTIKDKGAIRDVGRALNISLDEVSKICDAVDNEEAYKSVREQYKELFEYVDLVKGTVVSVGSHPCGLVCSPQTVDDNIGLFTTSTTQYPISQLNMKEIDSENYVKLDLLKLDTATVINETCKLAGIDRLTPDNMNVYDETVWNNIRDDSTAIFQWESDTGKDYIKKLMSDTTIEQFKKYNPNMDKLTLFTIGNSAIRPAGASYRNDLANGVVRTTGSKPIDDFLSNTFGYLVFQCQIIDFLHLYCGFTMGEADIVRRGFAKKTGTEQYIPVIVNGGYLNDNKKHYIDGYIKTMKDKYDIAESKSEEDITAFIQVIEDASDYLFSNNHSSPYSLEGYACGWLRTYYPLEFLTVSLNIQKDNMDKTNNLIDYANKVGIKILPIKFRYSGADYTLSKENGAIYKGISSIKNLNAEVSEQLYNLRDNNYNTFIDLLIDIKDKTRLNSRQLDILIKLDFFSEFGSIGKLLAITEYFSLLYGKKQMNKVKAEELELTELLSKYSGKETEKMYSQIDSLRLLTDICNTVAEKKITVGDIVKWQQEYLGYIDYKNDKLPKTNIIVTGLNTKYSPRFNAYCLNNGKIMELKVSNASNPKSPVDTFKKKPFENGDVLDIVKCTKKPKVKKTADGWETIPNEFNWWLDKYNIISLEG